MADVEQFGAIQVKPDVKLGDNTLHEADGSSVESDNAWKPIQVPRCAPIKPEYVFS